MCRLADQNPGSRLEASGLLRATFLFSLVFLL